MGLFSKKPKPEPWISIGEIRIYCSLSGDSWTFTFLGQDFCIFSPNFIWPGGDRLEAILKEIERLTPEMKERIRNGAEVGGGIPVNEGESFLVKLDDLAEKGSYEVGWSGGESWGDMGIDFVVQDGKITEEFWGD